MSRKDLQGEGNREADRRYRKGVRKTVAETSEDEREDWARSEDNLDEAREAEEEGKSRARR